MNKLQATLFIIFLVLFNGVCIKGSAQASLSNIETATKQIKDTNQINELLTEVYNLAYININYEKATKLCEDIIVASEKLNFKKGLADAHSYMGNILSYGLQDYGKATEHLKKALAIYTDLNNDMQIAYANQCLGLNYKGISDYENATYYFLNALKTYERIDTLYPTISIYREIAYI